MSADVASQPTESTEPTEPTEAELVATRFLPVPRFDRIVRKRFGGRRVSPGVAVYTAAALERVVCEVLWAAKAEATAAKKKRITRDNLVIAVRTHPELKRLFRAYAFATGTRVKYSSSSLLTKADRELAAKKRLEEKKKKEDAAVPAVDEA